MFVRVTGLCVIGICFVAGGIAQSTPSSTASPANTVPSSATPAPTHPPIPPANTPALPSEFSDIPQSVISCWDTRASYSSASWFLYTQLLSSEYYSFIPWNSTTLSLSPYLNGYVDCKTTAIPSETTLCDGHPRAVTSTSSCKTVEETYTWTVSGEISRTTPAWSTELEQLPSPTCTVATDFGPECSRLKDAYSWRQTYFESLVPSPTSGSIEGPGCSVLNSKPAGPKPTCLLEGGSWEAYYWPTPDPTGAAFCATNGTNITATPTIPGQPNTAVISGLTMISPSVYHFLRNVTLLTYAGRASLVGDAYTGTDTLLPSTTAPLLVASQRESDILTVSRLCAGSGRRRYCTYHASRGFSIYDQTTVRASEYCGRRDCGTTKTIYQGDYKPTLGIPASDIAAQNGLFSDCEWTTTGGRVRTSGPPVYKAGAMKTEDWHKIIATSSGVSQSRETAAPGQKV